MKSFVKIFTLTVFMSMPMCTHAFLGVLGQVLADMGTAAWTAATRVSGHERVAYGGLTVLAGAATYASAKGCISVNTWLTRDWPKNEKVLYSVKSREPRRPTHQAAVMLSLFTVFPCSCLTLLSGIGTIFGTKGVQSFLHDSRDEKG